MAASGDANSEWAVDRLLDEPTLSADAEPYFAAWVYLHRDRTYFSLSLGMGGGLRLPEVIPRAVIRCECERRGYEGEALEDAEEIIVLIDDEFVKVTSQAEAKAVADMAKKNKDKSGRPK